MEDCGRRTTQPWKTPGPSSFQVMLPSPAPPPLTCEPPITSPLHSEGSQLLPHKDGDCCRGALTSAPWVGAVASLGRSELISIPTLPRTLSWWDGAPILRGSEVPALPRGVGSQPSREFGLACLLGSQEDPSSVA